MNPLLLHRLSLWSYRAVSLVAFLAGLSLSLEQFYTGSACPVLGDFIPACYVITGILFVLFIMGFVQHKIIWFGTLAAALAFSGLASTSNLFQGGTCPVSEGGTPLCYIVFSMAFIMTVLAVIICMTPATKK